MPDTTPTKSPVDRSAIDRPTIDVGPRQRTEQQFDDQWGKLPSSRWKNVGRIWYLPLTDIATSASLGDTFHSITVPDVLDGAQIVGVEAAITSASASGGPILIQLNNGADILLTPINIDDGTKHSVDAATQPVIDKSNNILRSGDQIDIDIDDIGDGNAFGWQLFLYLQ